jgi:hypothetical protein
MTYSEIALLLDEEPNNVVEAAWAYELAIQEPNAPLIQFLNLAVLYVQCDDFGFASTLKISRVFFDQAYYRAVEVLDVAERYHGPQTEIDFWRLFIRQRIRFEDIPDEAYLVLAEKGDSLLPYLALFANSNGRAYHDQVAQLFSESNLGKTTRLRFIQAYRPSDDRLISEP